MYKRCAFAVFLLGFANAAPSRCVCLDAFAVFGYAALSSRCVCLLTLRFRGGWLRCVFAVYLLGHAALSRCVLALRLCAYHDVALRPCAYHDSVGDWHAACIKEHAVVRATPRAWGSSIRAVTRNATPVCIEFYVIRTRQTPPSCSAGVAHSLCF